MRARVSWSIIRTVRQKRFCGARTRRGTPCQCKAIETKRGALRCRLHGGLSTGPKSIEGRARIAAGQHARWARVAGNPLVQIVMAAETFLPLTPAGDVRRDWAAAGDDTSKVRLGAELRAPADLAASLVKQGQATYSASDTPQTQSALSSQ